MKDIVQQKNKGQALVEFILILPIIVMILFVVIDFSNIFYNKNHLEGILSDVIEYNERGKTKEEIKQIYSDENITINYIDSADTRKIIIEKNVNLVTPFSNTFFSNPYKITAERVVLNE